MLISEGSSKDSDRSSLFLKATHWDRLVPSLLVHPLSIPLGPVGGRDMATQEEGHSRTGSAPHTHTHMWAQFVPLLLIRRGGKWREG